MDRSTQLGSTRFPKSISSSLTSRNSPSGIPVSLTQPPKSSRRLPEARGASIWPRPRPWPISQPLVGRTPARVRWDKATTLRPGLNRAPNGSRIPLYQIAKPSVPMLGPRPIARPQHSHARPAPCLTHGRVRLCCAHSKPNRFSHSGVALRRSGQVPCLGPVFDKLRGSQNGVPGGMPERVPRGSPEGAWAMTTSALTTDSHSEGLDKKTHGHPT